MRYLSEAKMGVDIAAVIEGAGVELRRSGSRLIGRCPFHDEKTPSFFVFPDQQRYYCFGCQASGDVIDLAQALHGLDFRGALRHLGVERGRVRLSPVDRRRIDATRAERDRRRQRRTWLDEKVDELSLLVRCSHLMLDGIRTEVDLEKMAFLYHLLPVWKYKLGILLEGWNWEKWEFYKHEIKGASNGQREERADSERDSAQNC